MPTKYSKAQIAEKLDIRKRTITHYADLKLVLPSDPDVIQGRAREFDEQSLVEFGMVKVLVDPGPGSKDS